MVVEPFSTTEALAPRTPSLPVPSPFHKKMIFCAFLPLHGRVRGADYTTSPIRRVRLGDGKIVEAALQIRVRAIWQSEDVFDHDGLDDRASALHTVPAPVPRSRVRPYPWKAFSRSEYRRIVAMWFSIIPRTVGKKYFQLV